MSLLQRTYEVVANPPPPMPWREYCQIATDELKAALDRNATEADIQALLERHPCLVPGADGLARPVGHSPWPASVITQPRLPSYGGKVADFMWLSTDSLSLYPVLIEIESPGKPWFTKGGQPTSLLTQARDQLAEWRAWFSRPHNICAFLDFYRVPDILRAREFTPMYVLIYGRRKESSRTETLLRKRGFMQRHDEFIIHFDRLTPNAKVHEDLCVRVDSSGYTAVSVPPTMTLGPLYADRRVIVAAKEAAVRHNQYLTTDRKDFLCARLPYWDTWACQGHTGGCITDCE
jgi:hypothetical protein